MSNLHKHSNGVVYDLKVTLKEAPILPANNGPTTTAVSGIIRSTVPCLLFLFIYGINGRIRILPRAADVNCVTLHNVSTIEYLIFSVAPHRVISSVHSVLFDVLSALPYLLHYLIPLAYPTYLYATGRLEYVPRFFWLLGMSVWAHYLIWFLVPTAPPWVEDNLDQFRRSNTSAPPIEEQHREGCAFARLDRWTGLPIFFSIFAGNPVPFASFPSGHVAWPMCILMTLPTSRERRLFAFYIVWVSWATMYSCHHYLTDIVAAVVIVVALVRLLGWLNRPQQRRYRNVIDNCLLAVIAY